MSLPFIALPIASYLIGSIPSAVLVSRLLGLPDPRTGGSGNPGATNVLRLGGRKAAAMTLIGDLAKGLIPVAVARALEVESVIVAATGLGAFLGHLYPIYLGFRGGKGVATAAGVYAALSMNVIWILASGWLVVILISRYSSLAALSAALAAPLVFLLLGENWAFVLLAAIITLFQFWHHRSNIRRLLRGEESRVRLVANRN